MDVATRSHIFEPFFTTKDIGAGTGMGLATVWGIVRASGGSIELDTEPGRGTTFRLFFPKVEADVVEAVGGPAAAETPRGSETVLIVEDEPAVREFARRILSGLGYAVIDSANGHDALAMAADHHGPIDLLVSDVSMPGMQGPELARRLAAARPDLRILFVSGFADRLGNDNPARRAAGVDPDGLSRVVAYLAKPYAGDALGRAVRRLLDEQADPTAALGTFAT
jgi:CheY-like chemotaxis protein